MAKIKLSKEQMEELAINAGVDSETVAMLTEAQGGSGFNTKEELAAACQGVGLKSLTDAQFQILAVALVLPYA